MNDGKKTLEYIFETKQAKLISGCCISKTKEQKKKKKSKTKKKTKIISKSICSSILRK